MPAREYVVMQMAGEVGLNVPPTLLQRCGEREVFLIERFDRSGDPERPQRHLYASAHTVLGLDAQAIPGDARRSYLVLADQIRRWINDAPAHRTDLQELWRRMAYNALVGNGDDHPRNHGLIHTGTGWRLAPAFDITPQPNFARVLAMGVRADGSHDASAQSLLSACTHFGVDRQDAVHWLHHAAVHVAEHWERRMREAGVTVERAASFAPAFALATELAVAPNRLEMLADAPGSRAGKRGH